MATISRLVLAEIMHEHDQGAVDQLIRELGLDHAFDIKPGMKFTTPGR